jgi:diguanylate cyclase (GGDEF)-like protein/PAS domain S-box-containing protein
MKSADLVPLTPLHSRGLLMRSTLVVILASLLAGLAAIAYTARTTSQHAHQITQTRLNELLDTVESTLRVACFARDATLAGELAEGLLSNSDVLGVRIFADPELLADQRRHAGDGPPALRRAIFSPFDNHQKVGEILLQPDPQVIAARIREEVWFAALQLAWQLGMVAVAMAVIMLLYIVRPIKAISDRLHAMDPTAGERLATPRRHAGSEIGQLVIDINALSDRLVGALAAEHQLRVQREIDERKYHAIFNNAESGLFIVDGAGTLSSWNPAFARLFKIDPQSGDDEYTWLHISLLNWDSPERMTGMIRAALRENSAMTEDLLIHERDGVRHWINIVLSPVGDNLLQGVVHNISHLKEAEASARQLAVTDTLTGLVNRLGLEQRLQTLVRQYDYSQSGGFSLLLLNLDDFRRINEGMGLMAGDNILQTVTSRLSGCVKSDDCVARLSADNFGIILNDITRGEVADMIASRIMHALRQTYFVDGAPVNLHASIGITIFPHDANNIPNLLRQAELAMDSAKSAGGNAHVFFDPVLSESAEQRRQLENDLRGALRNQEFALFLQPIVDLRGNCLSGAEALLRWNHPTRGLTSPDSFIPLAEKTGLIVDIGLFMLDAACRQLLAWQQQGLDYTLSLNVSGRQIPDGLSPAKLREVTEHYGVSPGRLALEITEGVMLGDIDKSLRWLSAVHASGFRVYLDDFGTGYSSLSYLKQFPVDTLKIDKSFVRDMRQGNNENTLVSAIIAMGAAWVWKSSPRASNCSIRRGTCGIWAATTRKAIFSRGRCRSRPSRTPLGWSPSGWRR